MKATKIIIPVFLLFILSVVIVFAWFLWQNSPETVVRNYFFASASGDYASAQGLIFPASINTCQKIDLLAGFIFKEFEKDFEKIVRRFSAEYALKTMRIIKKLHPKPDIYQFIILFRKLDLVTLEKEEESWSSVIYAKYPSQEKFEHYKYPYTEMTASFRLRRKGLAWRVESVIIRPGIVAKAEKNEEGQK